jgi:hypothetical protein
MNTIEIPLSKQKIFLGIGVSLLFVILGYYLFATIADQQNRLDPRLAKAIGILGIIFFGGTGIFAIKKLFDKSLGLIISDEGIFENTNALSIGFISWDNITAIKTIQIKSTKILLIFVKNPQLYLDKVSGLKKFLMKSNFSMYGTPLSITSVTLKIKFNELEQIINQRFEEYRKNTISNEVLN